MSFIGKNIKWLRLLSGMTQEQFAEKFDSTKDRIYTYEKEKANPDILFLTKLSKFANVTTDEIYNKDLSNYEIKVKDPETKAMEFTISKAMDQQERELLEKLIESKNAEIKAKDELISTLKKLLEKEPTTSEKS